jgi:hypothetical protein
MRAVNIAACVSRLGIKSVFIFIYIGFVDMVSYASGCQAIENSSTYISLARAPFTKHSKTFLARPKGLELNLPHNEHSVLNVESP